MPINHLSVYQISRQLDNLLPLYGNIHTLTKRKKKTLSQFLKVCISEMPGMIYLKFGMRGTDGRGHLHSKNCLVSYKQNKVTYTWKLHYCSSCQYTHICGAPASWVAQHTTTCLDSTFIHILNSLIYSKYSYWRSIQLLEKYTVAITGDKTRLEPTEALAESLSATCVETLIEQPMAWTFKNFWALILQNPLHTTTYIL